MEFSSPKLIIEINNSNCIFLVGQNDTNYNYKIIYECTTPIEGVKNNELINFDLIYVLIKKNLYLIEQKLNFIFKDVILIVSDLNTSFINLSGFKKLNGSQILKENITYILNSLKSSINKFVKKKTILYIFN